MDAPLEKSVAADAGRLQGCIDELARLMAPLLVGSGDPSRIAATLLEALLDMLGLDVAYVRLNERDSGQMTELVRLAPSLQREIFAPEIGAALDRSLGAVVPNWPASAQLRIAGLAVLVAPARLGLQGELGVVVAGSRRPGFPGESERLLLDFAANHAAIALQEAYRRELAATNDTLKTELMELRRAQAALHESEANARMIINSVPAGIALLSLAGEVQVVNDQLAEYFGKSLDELKDWSQGGIIHPDDLASVVASYTQWMATGTGIDHISRLRRFDGAYRWTQVRSAPLRNAGGQTVSWCTLHTDVDERMRAEEQLRRSEGFLAAGQRLSLTGTFRWCSATEEFTWSEELYRIYEFQRDVRVTFELIASRYHPEEKHRITEIASQVRNGVPTLDYGHRLLMPDGSIKHLHVVAHGRLDKDGNGREYFGAVQDVTQRRLAEEARDRAASELAHVTRVMSLGALTASIAHEVSQPLAGILTNAGTCQRMLRADPPNIDGALETARRTIRDGNRAADVIVRLRALFARKAAVTETLDLNEATREVLMLLSDDLVRKGVVVRVELDDDPLLVTGDRIQLQQVILNLVRNAADAMADVHDRPRSLLVKVDGGEKGCALLIVKDAGAGFALKDAERLFDAFYTTKSDGIGIGLSLSRTIIERHGGRLWARPNDGPGATFSFSIRRFEGEATDETSASPPRIETRG
jgi:PAS domain S-box-containing protein